MSDRLATKRAEMLLLAEQYREHPELFAQQTFVEDAPMLAEFGMYFPGKERALSATLKLWPEDFIVEEIADDGTVRTITPTPIAPVDAAPTIYATLVKSGLSTFEAVDDLAQQLGIRKEDISYAGIKDKDAFTAQRISLRRADPAAVARVTSPFFFLKDIEAGKGVVEKGRLKGNRFTILIRTRESLLDRQYSDPLGYTLKRVLENGFYNFFYLQRFGTPRLRNFRWAIMILQGNYEEAVRDIVTHPSERESGYFKQVRAQLLPLFGDWHATYAALEPFPLIFTHELKIVSHLAEHPGDFSGALQTIPDQIVLWMYAFSSYLFNRKISEYLQKGQEPPAKLPVVLSPSRADWDVYGDMLRELDLYPMPLHNLHPFPNLQIRHNEIATKDYARLIKGEVVKEGLILQFELGKGQYATTFLSHIFNLTSGLPLEGISKERVDTKAALGEPSLAPLLERFASTIHAKGENVFEELLGAPEK